ncbi:MAG: peptidoglycan editing factor PgeF [Anaerolineae bacterium]|nr:peptidoglycan editing factor PgeF [Anaerolineae bacterium]
MERVTTKHDLTFYSFSGWAGVKQAIFTRHGGVSQAPFHSLNMGGTVGDDVAAVRQNHELMYDALDIDAAKTVTVWMVHGVDTVIANAPIYNRRWLAQADAIMTDKLDLTLVMRYADCTPIMAFDTVRGVIGIAHAGWQGTVNGMAGNLIKAMSQAYGSRPQDIFAGIGPSIGPKRYQVGEEVVAAVYNYFGVDKIWYTLPLPEERVKGLDLPLITRDPADGTAYFNLWEANRRDLLRTGVERIEVMGLCTATHTHDWFSHRAEKGKTGRFGAVISLV